VIRSIQAIVSTAVVAALAVAGGLSWTPSASAEEISNIVRGGTLYDKWYKVTKASAPKDAHPAYPKDKKYAKKPGANWRCKECHGWDGMGKDGAYKAGKHATGIKGINGMAGADPAKVVAVLKDNNHQYADKVAAADLNDLALFVAKGQIDMDKYIDRATKAPKGGDAAKGEAYFNTMCANCHGRDGTLPKDMGKSLGAQMGNPWEVMHKIVNGQPGEQMPALRAFGMQPVVDIMAHLKTLTTKK